MVNGRDIGKLEEGRSRALGGRSSLAQGWEWGKEFFGKDIFNHLYTVKTLGLLQPYFGHLSCIPVAYVTCYALQTSMDASKV